MKRLSAVLIMMIFLSAALRGDSLSFSFFHNMTDNIFQNIYPGKDNLSQLTFYAVKDFSKISLFTEGNYSYLFENTVFSYYFQNAGLDYLHPVSRKTAFYFSLLGQWAFYRTEYDDFNYFSLHFLAAAKAYLSPTSIFKSDYTLEYKKYRYSLFDFVSHSLVVSFDTYFQTRTTIKAEANWGLKSYLHPYSSVALPVDVSMGPYGRQSYLFIPRTQYSGQKIQVLSLGGLIAQGIGGKIGLNVAGMRQWIFSGENPFTSVEEFYLVENPSCDQFSWTGYRLGSQLTVLIPWDVELKLRYNLGRKEFSGIESRSLDGEPLGMTRKDKRHELEARLAKNFSRFSLFLSSVYIDNDSNDPFFNWEGYFFSAGIEWNLFFGEKR